MENLTPKKEYEVAEIQLLYTSKVKSSMRPKITNSRAAFEIFLDNWHKAKIEFVEQFKVMLLNRANKVLGLVEISSGSSTGTIADPKLIFVAAIKANACGVIVAHNHPSDNLKPSHSDIEFTKRLKECGKLLEVQVLDHIILSKEGFYSFADEGLL